MLLADLGSSRRRSGARPGDRGDADRFRALAEIKRMTDEDRALMSRMEAVLDRRALPAVVRLAIHFGLGKAHDDLAEYAKAIGHYDAGNRLRASSIRFNRQDYAAGWIASCELSPRRRSRPGGSLTRPARPEDDPPVLWSACPGPAPPSSSRSCHRTRRSRPAANSPFGHSDWRPCRRPIASDRTDPDFGGRGGYLSLLRAFGPNSLRVTDKMPRNYELLWLVRLSLPEARIIHCRRHPVDTCLSNYFTNFSAGHDYAWDRGDLCSSIASTSG